MRYDEGFERWLEERTQAVTDRSSRIDALHNDFVAWSIHHDVAPLGRARFTTLLQAARQEIRDGAVSGLALAHLASVRKEEAFAEAPLEKGAITAAQWLEDQLRNGPRGIIDIRGEATAAHFSWATVRRAKTLLGVRTPLHGVWELPKSKEEAA